MLARKANTGTIHQQRWHLHPVVQLFSGAYLIDLGSRTQCQEHSEAPPSGYCVTGPSRNNTTPVLWILVWLHHTNNFSLHPTMEY